MNTTMKTLSALTGLALVAGTSNAAPITVGNHSFEDATNTSWQRSDNGSTPANPVRTDTSISAKHDAPPDGTDWIHHSNGQASHDIYQVLGANLAANTTYTLTVDVGDRRDHSPGAPLVRLGTVSASPTATDDYGLNLLTPTTALTPTPVNGAGDSDGWETWVLTFTTGAAPAGLGDALRVELENTSGAQSLFDNVRLTAVPEPGSLAILGLGGLLIARRRRG